MSFDEKEKIDLMLDLLDYEMMEYIYKVLDSESGDPKYCAIALNDMLTYYIEVRSIFSANSPNNQKDLFLFLTCSRRDFREFKNRLKREWKCHRTKQALDTVDRVKYVVDFLINEYICQVLEDSSIEPEYSAVTLNNEMICYLELMKKQNIEPQKSIKDFFISLGHSEEEFNIFEEKRQKESEYYVGKQYAK